jgi:hypothetical protein
MAHSPAPVQAIPPVQLDSPVTSTAPAVHADAPPVGSVDAISSPQESPAAHSVVVGHEIAPIQLPESTLAAVQALTSPSGSDEVTTSPLLSPAAQNEGVGHDTERMSLPEAAGEIGAHAGPPCVGVVVSRSWPTLSTAAQKSALAHESAMI